jgi:hypothetical protein
VKGALFVREPETPLIATGKLPTVAVLLAVNVAWLVPVVPTVPKNAVTPLGSPDTARLTLLLKPFCGVTVAVPPAVNPRGRPRLPGRKDSVKFGAVMVNPTIVVLLSVPDVPVTVTLYVPTGAVLLALKVRELVLLVLTGLNAAVTPVGNAVAVRPTIPVKPFWPLTLIVLLPLLARGTVRLAAEAERLKLGATMVSAIVAALLRLPETPVTVIG